MARIQAYCGLDCGECEAYVATQKNDRAGLDAVAKKWAAQFGGKDMGGDVTCAHCADYGCATLQQFFAFAPVLKDKLEAIRKEIGK
jgi:Fe-S-cluster-containing hydrogenase component 2